MREADVSDTVFPSPTVLLGYCATRLVSANFEELPASVAATFTRVSADVSVIEIVVVES